MCFHSSKNIGRALLLALAFCLLSLVGYSQDQEKSQSLGPIQSQNSTESMTDLPPPPIVQLDSSKPIIQRLTTALESWMTWYNQVQAWSINHKALLKKQREDQQKALDAKDAVIAGKDLEIALLKDQLAQASGKNIQYGIGGLLAGVAGGIVIKTLIK